MNEEPDQDTLRLKQLLEEVTAAGDTARSGNGAKGVAYGGDAETASLREAWLAFGQLAAAADASLPVMPDLMTSIAPRKAGRSRWFGLMAATAAAVLVAVTLGWWIARNSRQPIGEGSNREPSLAQTIAPEQVKPQAMKQDLPKSAVTQAPKAASKKSKAATATTSDWDDPLDTQISSVSQEIRDLQQNWQHRVDDVDLVQYRIDEVSDSLQNDAL